MFKTHLTALLLSLVVGSAATAQSGTSGVFYIGGGLNNDGATTEIDETPFVLGVLASSRTSSLLFGFDIAAEGEMLDSTYGGDALRQALSINALIGANVYKTSGFRTDASLILGLRESFADCSDSFIGFQCYADQEPEVDYDFNYGALINFSFESVTLGIRATEVSTQAVLGFNF